MTEILPTVQMSDYSNNFNQNEYLRGLTKYGNDQQSVKQLMTLWSNWYEEDIVIQNKSINQFFFS